MIFTWAQSQLNERPRIGNRFVLPAIVALKAAHGLFAGLVPSPTGFAVQVVLVDQGLLNCLGAL